jgi:hypothetical protein
MSETVQPTVPAGKDPFESPGMAAAVAALNAEADTETVAEEGGVVPPAAPETPAAEPKPAETPAEPADATPDPEPAPATPAAPETPANPVISQQQEKAEGDARLAAAQAEAAEAQRLREVNAEITRLRALPKDQRDIDHAETVTDLLAEKDALRDKQVSRLEDRAAAADQAEADRLYWAGEFTEKYPGVDATKAQKAWVEEAKKAIEEFGEGWRPAAVVAWRQRVGLMKGHAEKKAPTPAPAPTTPPRPTGGTIVPAASSARPTPAADPSPEDELVATVSKDIRKYAMK